MYLYTSRTVDLQQRHAPAKARTRWPRFSLFAAISDHALRRHTLLLSQLSSSSPRSPPSIFSPCRLSPWTCPSCSLRDALAHRGGGGLHISRTTREPPPILLDVPAAVGIHSHTSRPPPAARRHGRRPPPRPAPPKPHAPPHTSSLDPPFMAACTFARSGSVMAYSSARL